MIETPMYQGVTPQRQTEPRMIKLDDVYSRAAEQAADRAVGAIDMVEQTFDYMMDYNTAKNTEQQLSAATSEYDQKVKDSAALESGHPDSLWNDDGTMREERMAELKNEYEQKVNAINPRFIDSRRGFQTHEQIEAVHDKTIERSEAFAHGLKLKKAREGVLDRYDNYVARGDTGAAIQELDNGVRAGLLSKVKADTMKIKLAKSGVGGSGSVRVGGVDYEGWEAQLAAQTAREAKAAPAAPKAETAEGSGEMAGLRLDANYMPQDEGQEFTFEKSEQPEMVGVDEQQLTLTPLDDWQVNGEDSGMIGLMNDAEYERLQIDLTGQAELVKQEKDPLGNLTYSAGDNAPEVAQVAVAGANKRGAMSKDEARAMVTGILLDKYVTYGELSEDAAAKIFEDSGVYEALGDGNENMGIAEVKGLANEVKKRAGNADMSRLDNKGIETLVDMQLDAGGWGTDKDGNMVDWARMEDIEKKVNADSGYVKDGKWDKSEQSEEGRKDWFYAYELYKQHRNEYNPKAEGDLDKDEAEEKLPGFVRWWNGKYGNSKKAVARKAQKAYLMGEVYRALQNSATATSNGTKYEQDGQIVNDVAVTRETLRRASGAPLNDAVEAYLNEQDAREKQTEATIKQWHEEAQAANKKLNEVMAAKAEEEAAAKEQAAKEKEEKKKREKEEEKAAAAAEAEAARRKRIQQALARRQPVAQSWTWDGVARGKSGALVCKLPKKELQRIKSDMGYDGGQFVILKIGNSSKSIYVDMEHAAKGEAIELSSAAVKLMQETPTGRGRKRVVPAVKSKGQADFYYEFKEIK